MEVNRLIIEVETSHVGSGKAVDPILPWTANIAGNVRWRFG